MKTKLKAIGKLLLIVATCLTLLTLLYFLPKIKFSDSPTSATPLFKNRIMLRHFSKGNMQGVYFDHNFYRAEAR